MKLGFKQEATGELVSIDIAPKRIGNIAIMTRGMTKVSSLEGLRFSLSGIIKEFPDLEGKPIAEIRSTAIERLKKKVSELETEDSIAEYLKDDLAKHGYTLMLKQRVGWRPEHIR